MTNISIAQARTDLYELAKQVIESDDVISITTKDGNVVMISEEKYRGMMETIYLHSIPDVAKTIVSGLETPAEECQVFNWKDELK